MRISNFLNRNRRMKRNTSQNGFWDTLPLVSSLVIAASIFMYLAWLFDPNRTSENSFFNLVTPNLNEIRNGRYIGLLTSSLIETNILFLCWAIGWMWFFGKTIENHVSIFFYIFLVISSIVFPELFQILIFEETSYGLGGILFALSGFLWFMSVYEPLNWSISYREKLSSIAFILLCILLTYTKIYKVGIAGLVGGVIWGVFVGFVSRSIKNMILQISILLFVVGLFFIPIFWAPWQNSWLLNEAEKYEKQNNFEEAKELYSKILKKDSNNKEAQEGLINILSREAEQYYNRKEYKKSKDDLDKILAIDPNDQAAKHNLKLVLVGELVDEAKRYYDQKECNQMKETLNKILAIDPDNEAAEEYLKVIPCKSK